MKVTLNNDEFRTILSKHFSENNLEVKKLTLHVDQEKQVTVEAEVEPLAKKEVVDLLESAVKGFQDIFSNFGKK